MVKTAVDGTPSGQPRLYPPVHSVGNGHDAAVGASQDGKDVCDGIAVVLGTVGFVFVERDGIAIDVGLGSLPLYHADNRGPCANTRIRPDILRPELGRDICRSIYSVLGSTDPQESLSPMIH